MRIRLFAMAGLAWLAGTLPAQSLAEPPPAPQVSHAARQVISAPLRDLQAGAPAVLQGAQAQGGLSTPATTGVVEIPRFDRPVPPHKTKPGEDTAVQSSAVPHRAGTAATAAMPGPEQNFDGQPNVFGYLPPDTVGDVGPNHYVQMVNLTVAIFNKTGRLLLGPVASNVFWSSLEGLCASNNDGDGVVLYDQATDRWILSQFAINPPNDYHQCVAVSQGSDPTGAWYQYDFLISDSQFNDYPKLAVWPDAYYMSANNFDGTTDKFTGVSAIAFERDKMLQGLPARMVKFDFPLATGFYSMLPADWDGAAAPPAGAPNLFAYSGDDAYGYPADSIWLRAFHVDWTTPANSTFTALAEFPTAPFDSILCGGSRNCIPQPGGTPVDALGDRLMFRNQYRNFGGYQTMVFNQTVDTDGNDHAGIRWYELRDTGSGWGIYQQGTYAPDGNHRWIGSIAMDKDGNLALGYSLASTAVYPSVAYTGRLAGDPLGTLPQGESLLVTGGGSQSSRSGRWGDYSAMSVDPVDDCTFWYTQEYYASDSKGDWRTRIGSFRFPGCLAAPTGSLSGTATVADSGDPVPGAQIAVGGLAGFTGPDGGYTIARVPVGTYDVTASAYGYEAQTVAGLTISEGSATRQSFTLEPLPKFTVCGTVTDGSGQGWPLYARIAVSDPRVAPVFTDPLTGHYCIDLLYRQDYTLLISAQIPGYLPATRSLTAGTQDQSFALAVDTAACSSALGYHAQIDDVMTGDCVAIPDSGLVIGRVRDANTGAAITGASIQDSLGHSTTSLATAGDPTQNGFYALASQAGDQTLTATTAHYGAATPTVSVGSGAVVEQDLDLPAANLVLSPLALEFTIPQGGVGTSHSEILNTGGNTANFEVLGFNAPYLAPTPTGPYAEQRRLLSPAHLNDRNAKELRVRLSPALQPLAAGDLVRTWPTGLAMAWGLGYDQGLSDLWLSDNPVFVGSAASYRYLTDGTATGDVIDTSAWAGDVAADMTYNPSSRMLWQVALYRDYCIHELDPAAKTSTGRTICPAFGTSQRGLAYDLGTDTYYSGSWNDGIINHFAPDGTLLDSAYVGLPIAGLAYNPATGHLFVANNSEAPDFDISVLDVHAGYAPVGGFDIPGLSDSGQAGLEIDCAGHLWAVDQNTQMVLAAKSGETGVCNIQDIPWLSVTPDSGTIAAGAAQTLTYQASAAGLATGHYEAYLRILNDSPYGDLILPVTLTVTPPPPTDLAIAVADTPDPARAGARLDYRVTVHNKGPAVAVGAVVTATLPGGVTPRSTTGCAGDPAGIPACALGDIPVDGELSYSITADVGIETKGQIIAQVDVTAVNTDPAADNNSATAATRVIALGDLDGDGCVGRADGDRLLAAVRTGATDLTTQDINRDGAVNRADPRALMLRYTKPPAGTCP